MEPITLTVAALAFVGSCVVQKCADATLEAAWARISARFKKKEGAKPTGETVDEETALQEVAPSLRGEAETIFGLSTGLRRAKLVSSVLDGAHVLWIDDHPENNRWERSMLRAFSVHVTSVETTRSAMACLQTEAFDVVVSDIAREGRSDEGVRALAEFSVRAPGLPILLYVGYLNSDSVPRGAFGITNDPNELLHLLLDALERSRV